MAPGLPAAAGGGLRVPAGWRTANSNDIKDEAVQRHVSRRFSDGQSKQENQIQTIGAFVAQRADAVMFPPVVSPGWAPVLREVKAADLCATPIGSDVAD